MVNILLKDFMRFLCSKFINYIVLYFLYTFEFFIIAVTSAFFDVVFFFYFLETILLFWTFSRSSTLFFFTFVRISMAIIARKNVCLKLNRSTYIIRWIVVYLISIIFSLFIIRHNICVFWWLMLFFITPISHYLFTKLNSRLESFNIRYYKNSPQTFHHNSLINYHKNVQRILLSICFIIEV